MTRRQHRLSFNQVRQLKRLGSATLTEAEVRIIKQKLAEGMSPRELAEVYQVCLETVRRIRRGDSWAWVQGEAPSEEPALAPLTPELEAKIAASQAEMMKRFGLQVPERTVETEAGIERLAREVQRAQEPDRLLDELEGGSKDENVQ